MIHESLTSWTEKVFSLLKEPDGTKSARQQTKKGDGPFEWYLFNAVNPEHFLLLMNEYAKKAENEMSDPSIWLNEEAPQKSFFNFERPWQEEDSNITNWFVREKAEKEEGELLFVQKTNFPKESEICFFGDYHGSIHSCLRNLWRLVAQGYIDTDFRIIKENFFIVCLGDYVDRGWFGLEVIYTLLLLKLAPGNWEKVFLLKGNHETINQSAWTQSSTGLTLFGELASKFGSTRGDHHAQPNLIELGGKSQELSMFLLNNILKWYTFLPFALFAGNGNDEYIQCAHGGIEQGYDFELITTQDKTKKYQQLKGLCLTYHNKEDSWRNRDWRAHSGFNWSDFFQGRYNDDDRYLNSESSCQEKPENLSSPRGCGIVPSTEWTEKYLAAHPFIKGFFRGHQDLFYGLKMLFKPDQQPSEANCLERVKHIEKKEHINKIIAHYWQSTTQCAMKDIRRYTSDDPKIQAKIDAEYQASYKEKYKEIKKKYPYFFSLAAKNAEYTYKKGPFHWRLVVSEQDQKNPKGFLINNYFPVFTFSSAPFGRGLEGNLFPFDCYGILSLSLSYESWRLRIHEYTLSNDRDNKYVSIGFTQKQNVKNDPLYIEWTENPAKICFPK